MSGYAGYSMSQNAVAAYDDYKMPASRAKNYLGLKNLVGISASEWHHTSKEYNCTDFYDLRDLITADILAASSRPAPTPSNYGIGLRLLNLNWMRETTRKRRRIFCEN